MSIQAVIDRALKDEKFAEELRDQALAAVQANAKGPEWEKFASNFAESPEDLARFNIPSRRTREPVASDEVSVEQEGTTTATTSITTTTTTITTLACTTTTTTSTTTLTTTTTFEARVLPE